MKSNLPAKDVKSDRAQSAATSDMGESHLNWQVRGKGAVTGAMLRDTAWRTLRLNANEDGAIATLTLYRPEALNALSRELAAELTAASEVLQRQEGVRVLIVTGAGERAFCAGADLKERKSLTAADRAAHTRAIEAAVEAIAALPMPTIAAIRGYALAGGSELAVACDLRVAATDAVLGFPEVKIGIFPGAGGVLRLPKLVGSGAARDLLFSGRRVVAEEALDLGLIDRLVAPDEVLPEATELAEMIAANAPLAVRAVKRALADSAARPHEEARRIVNSLRAALDGTDDYEEGLAAFAERRSPRFTGR
jgi:enoyl-CoA hydratase/carnithine racemase